MGKKIVDDESLTMLAEEMRGLSGGTEELVFPEGFVAEARSISAGQYNKGHKQGMDDFLGNRNIGEFYSDTLTSAVMYAFAGRTSMTSVYLPKFTSSSNYIFYNCTGLVRAMLPAFNTANEAVVGSYFYECDKLQFVDFGNVGVLANSTFIRCSVLKELVLRRSSAVVLSNVLVFNGTPYAQGGTGGKIYVPAALIEEYKTATNWSALYAYGTVEFVALEGSEYENADY